MGNSSPPRRDEEREKAIVRDYEGDLGTADIQAKYEISPGQLYRILDKYGVKPRRSPGVRAASPQPEGDRKTAGQRVIRKVIEDVIADRETAGQRAIKEVIEEASAAAPDEAEMIEVEMPESQTLDLTSDVVVETPQPLVVGEPVAPGYVYTATVEYRIRDVVRITASSIVDAARQAGSITSQTGEPVEVVMLAREG